MYRAARRPVRNRRLGAFGLIARQSRTGPRARVRLILGEVQATNL